MDVNGAKSPRVEASAEAVQQQWFYRLRERVDSER